MILITAAVAVAYWLISPLFINTTVKESLDVIGDPDELVVIGEGDFVGADDFHQAEGVAKLIKVGDKYFVRFEDNFMVTNEPDLFVHFGKDGVYVAEARIAALKGNMGSQNYEVPANLNPENYNEIWIWCRAFFVPFGKAKIM